MAEPVILVDPLPRTLDLICEPDVRRRLEALGRLEVSEDRPMDDERVDRLLGGKRDCPRDEHGKRKRADE